MHPLTFQPLGLLRGAEACVMRGVMRVVVAGAAHVSEREQGRQQ
jgi:hypothetical protein